MGDSKDTEPQDTNTAQSSAILDDGLDSVDDIMVGMYDGSESGFKTAAMAGSSTPLSEFSTCRDCACCSRGLSLHTEKRSIL